MHTKISSSDFNDQRIPTVEECQRRWKFLNTGHKDFPPWSQEEKELLKQLIEEAQHGDTSNYARAINFTKTGIVNIFHGSLSI
jgi:hypothetical protein